MISTKRRWMAVAAVIAVAALIGGVIGGCTEEEDGRAAPADKLDKDHPGDRGDGPRDGKFDAPTGEIISVDQSSFDGVVLESDIPVLLDFTADWCGPCRALHPTLEELASEYAGQVRVAQVDVDENADLARQYDVRGIPALFLVKDGQTVDEVVGLQSKADLKTMLDRHVD